jgi:hypothetical protein
MGRLIPAGTGMEFYRKIKIPYDVIVGLGGSLGFGINSPHGGFEGPPA